MRQAISSLVLVLAAAASTNAAGLLIPEDKKLPPLAMVHHRVNISIEDQVTVTTIEQAFRNHTDRQLEATYLFPIPKGASVNKFTMWVGDTETTGELLDSKKASHVYTDIVRRTHDPAILEYLGNNLMRLKVFPVLPHKDTKVKISYTSVAPQDNGVVEYIYPLKTDGKATKTLEEFSVKARIKSQHPIQNVYSPTHAIALTRISDKEVAMTFERSQAVLDKDFQLFYSVGNKEIGVTPLFHRPISSEEGYFLLLISPQMEVSKSTIIPRDLVLVLDTSGSMDAVKMDQARKAVKHCLSNLNCRRSLRDSSLQHERAEVSGFAGRSDERTNREREEVGGRSQGRRRHRDPGGARHRSRNAYERRGALIHGCLLHRRPADHRRNEAGAHRQECR